MSLIADPARTALVLIDLQNGIVAMNVAPHPSAGVIEKSVALAHAVAHAGGILIPVTVGFAPDFADRPQGAVDAPMQVPPGGLPPGWATLVPDIAALPNPVPVHKRNWGAFHGTDLDLQLRRRGITTLILGGIATNFGVEQTAREAWQHSYNVVIAEDACTSVSPEMHLFSIEKILPRLARIASTAEILAALKS